MRLIIISGRSGSGKSTALHELEDEGFYSIDNLPVSLLPQLVERAKTSNIQRARGLCVCIDARNAWQDLENFANTLESLPSDVEVDILYLDADDEVLLKRFAETRRRHPLSYTREMTLSEALAREQELLEPLCAAASAKLDSSQMTVYELRDAIKQTLLGGTAENVSILVQSFGFKHGVPRDADLVYDLRLLRNPHWEPTLRQKTGQSADVQEYIDEDPRSREFLADVCTFLEKWLPQYCGNSRSYITIALGCTGGKHRSVYLAERLYQHLKTRFPQVHLRHRDLQ
jgi:UPF0042 nucleotide-binding protein